MIIQPEIFELIVERDAFPIMDLYLRLMDTQRILGYRHDKNIWLEFGRMDRINEYSKSKEFKRIVSNY
jgi:hypothetical protein